MRFREPSAEECLRRVKAIEDAIEALAPGIGACLAGARADYIRALARDRARPWFDARHPPKGDAQRRGELARLLRAVQSLHATKLRDQMAELRRMGYPVRNGDLVWARRQLKIGKTREG